MECRIFTVQRKDLTGLGYVMYQFSFQYLKAALNYIQEASLLEYDISWMDIK